MEFGQCESIVVSQEEMGLRLDQILAARFENIKSRSYFQYLIGQKKVLLNGTSAKKRIIPSLGDKIEIQFLCPPELKLAPEPIPLDILYEDRDIILVNKPAGMVVHPAPGHWSGTFVNGLLHHCQQIAEMISSDPQAPNYFRPGVVHRLDKDTTGLLLAAKTHEAQAKLAALFATRQIHKEYLAVCIGKPGDLDIQLPIGRHPIHRKQMAVVFSGGKEALSRCKTLGFNGELSLVNIILFTGRTHQIRVHLAAKNAPVLGDSLYGNEQKNRKYGISSQFLLAHHLRFSHPFTGNLLEFKAPPSGEMQAFMDRSGLARFL